MNRRHAPRLLLAVIPFFVVGVGVLIAYATALAQPGGATVGFMMTTAYAVETQGSVTISVTLTNPPQGQDVTVQFATADGTATAPADYANTSATLTWPAGTLELTKSITITIVDDGIPDSGETFSVSLSNAQNATIDAQKQTCTVTVNDSSGGPGGDPPLPKVQFSGSIFCTEKSDDLSITVKVVGEHKETVKVKYATSDGTAKAGEDYVATSGELSFPEGVSEKTFKLVIKKDLKVEGDETIFLTLSEPSKAELGMPSMITVTIEDCPPVLTITAEKSAICSGGVVSVAHQTSIEALLTDGVDPIKGEEIKFANDKGSLSPGTATTSDNGLAFAVLYSDKKASHGIMLYQATVSASVGGTGGVEASCKVEFQPPVAELTATYPKIVTGETTPLKVTFTWNKQEISQHGLEWKTPAEGFGVIQSGASTQTDVVGEGTAVYESAENGGIVELAVIDTTVSYCDSGNPCGTLNEDVQKPALKIKRQRDGAGGYQDIAPGVNDKLLVGELIDLKMVLDPTPRDPAQSSTWTIPGPTFKDYTASDQAGKLTNGSGGSGDTIYFYYALDGAKEIAAELKIGKVKINGKVTLSLTKPLATFEFKVGEVKILNNNKLQLVKKADTTSGIDFIGKVQVPSGFSEGKWHFGQLIKPGMYSWEVNDGKKHKYPKNGEPYKSDPPWIYDSKNPFTPEEIKTGDSPFYDLDSARETKFQLSDSFQTFIMFRPDGTQSRYVPLKRLDWSWAGTATWDAATNTWNLSGAAGPPAAIAVVDCTTHPEWGDYYGPEDDWPVDN